MVLKRFVSSFLHPWTFWIGLSLFVGGAFVPEWSVIRLDSVTALPETITLPMVVVGVGNLIITGLLLISTAVILWTTYEGWRDGYAEGRH